MKSTSVVYRTVPPGLVRNSLRSSCAVGSLRTISLKLSSLTSLTTTRAADFDTAYWIGSVTDPTFVSLVTRSADPRTCA